jgi:RNA polymerase sigma-70 factor (ECF subfamily)
MTDSSPPPASAGESSAAEQAIRDAIAAGDVDAATTLALNRYGPEIMSFLSSRLPSRSDAEDAFSIFAERLWLGLPTFGWRCSMRTWSYTLARNVAVNYATSPHRRAGRNVPLSNPGVLSKLAEVLRSVTNNFCKTEVKDQFRALREQLASDDQILLVLRIDRGLAWRDLAITMSGDIDLDDAELARESARLRKVFERIKRDLRQLAEREGLLPARDG